MKIGMICYPSYGGSGVVATELGLKLALQGHEVHFISYERPFRLDFFHENIFLHEVEVFDYPLFKFPPYSIALTGTIVEVTKEVGLDLLHVHYAIPHAYSAFVAREMLDKKVPLITTLHGTDITLMGGNRQFYDVIKFCLKTSDGVTAVSQSLKDKTESTFEIPGKIEVIYNFIDPEEYRLINTPCVQGLRSRYASQGEKVVIHISNFREVKKVGDVVRTFALINQKVPAKLLLVGDGPERAETYRLAEELGISERVCFLGKQERVVELLSVSDLFLLPSAQESFGLVALEAMACQVPVIATDVGGLPEVVKDGQTGYLLPVGAVEQMAAKGIKLLSDEILHSQMAAKARSYALEKFPADKIVSQYEAYYQKILAMV